MSRADFENRLKKYLGVIEKYRKILAYILLILLSIVFWFNLECEQKNLAFIFQTIYPELAGSLLIYLILRYESDSIQKGLNENKQEQILESSRIFPPYIEVEDVVPFLIEETKIQKSYSFNKETLTFDIECKMTFKIIAGNQDIEVMSWNYGTGGCTFNQDSFNSMEIRLENEKFQELQLRLDVERKIKNHKLKVSLINRKLKKGERLEYCLILKYNSYQFVSLEELNYFKEAKKYPQFDHIFQTRRGILGMKRLIMEITFPHNYQPTIPDYEVLNTAFSVIPKEQERLSNNFKCYDKTLSLTVDNPIVNLYYSIKWKLPTLDELNKTGLLSTDNVIQIKNKLQQS